MAQLLRLSAVTLPLLTALMLPSTAQAATQAFTITSFDSVRVDAPVTVLVTTGSGTSARAEGDQGLIDRLNLTVSGGLLVVRLKAPLTSDKPKGGILRVRVTTQDVHRALLTGGGTLTIDKMRGQRGLLSLGGGGNLTVGAIAVDRLSADLSGGGRMTLSGNVGDAVLSVSGPGAFVADGLKARNAKLLSNGSGSLIATVVTSADIVASGAGDVTVLGKPACKVTHNGTGRVLCAGEEQ